MSPKPKVKTFLHVSAVFAMLALLLGAAAFLQKCDNFYYLGWLSKNGIEMKLNTAVIVTIGGLSILFLYYGFTNISRLLVFIIFVFSFLISLEYLLQVDLGIDNWLQQSKNADRSFTGLDRTSFLTAITSLMLSISIFLLSFKRYMTAQLLAGIAFTLVYASLIANIFTAAGIFQTGLYVSTKFYAALALLLLSVAIVFYDAEQGWMALVSNAFSNRKAISYSLAYILCAVPVLVVLYLYVLEQELTKASGILVLLVVTAVVSIPVTYRVLSKMKVLDLNLKKANEQFIIAIRASGMGIWEMDLGSGIITRSEKQAELFGQQFTETINNTLFFDAVFEQDRESIWTSFLDSQQSGQIDAEFRVLMPDFGLRWIQVCGETKYDKEGKPVKMLGTMKDITSRKELERHKDEFVTTVSHELKTPITSIKAQTQLLERKFLASGDLATSMMLRRVNLQINRLNRIISDLLEAGQIEEQKLDFRKEQYLFKEMVEEAVADVQRTTVTHELIVVNHPEISCIGDRDKTCQVLTNLLTNAIKYSPFGNKVIVNFDEQEDQVYCSVQDFGLGIEPEKQDHIFERFYRVKDSSNRIASGFGLGLYICSQLIKRLHGKIGLNSIPGEGSVFYFSVPKVI